VGGEEIKIPALLGPLAGRDRVDVGDERLARPRPPAVPHFDGRGVGRAPGGGEVDHDQVGRRRGGLARGGTRQTNEAERRRPEDGVDGLLRSHPLLSSARIVDDGLLADYPADAIRALTRFRVIGGDLGNTEARDAARDLLDATAATHLLRLSADPPRFLAVSAGGLSGDSINDELTLTATLIEKYA